MKNRIEFQWGSELQGTSSEALVSSYPLKLLNPSQLSLSHILVSCISYRETVNAAWSQHIYHYSKYSKCKYMNIKLTVSHPFCKLSDSNKIQQGLHGMKKSLSTTHIPSISNNLCKNFKQKVGQSSVINCHLH